MVTEKEKHVREDFSCLQNLGKQLNIVKNDLIPIYGKEATLDEVFWSLVERQAAFNQRIHEAFEDFKSQENNVVLDEMKILLEKIKEKL